MHHISQSFGVGIHRHSCGVPLLRRLQQRWYEHECRLREVTCAAVDHAPNRRCCETRTATFPLASTPERGELSRRATAERQHMLHYHDLDARSSEMGASLLEGAPFWRGKTRALLLSIYHLSIESCRARCYFSSGATWAEQMKELRLATRVLTWKAGRKCRRHVRHSNA